MIGTESTKGKRSRLLQSPLSAVLAAAIVVLGFNLASAPAAHAAPDDSSTTTSSSKMQSKTNKDEDPTQTVRCDAITADYHRPLVNGDHINVTIDPPGGQVNISVDQNIAGGASYNGQNNLGLRMNILGPEVAEIPLTLEQIKSGIIRFDYGAELIKRGYTKWKVSFVQTNGRDTWPNTPCGEDTPLPKDADASVAVKDVATCDAASTVTFSIQNATWNSEAIATPGTHSRTATADKDHLFADGTTTKTVEYTISDKKPSQSTDPTGECYTPPPVSEVKNNPVVTHELSCGKVVFTFTNQVTLGENEVSTPAVFTYTDATSAVQEVTVPVNETRSATVSFPEDSGEHVVSFGVKGKDQQSVTVTSDCVPNVPNPPEITPVTPAPPVFTDECGTDKDSYTVPGTLKDGVSTTEYGSYQVSDTTEKGVRTVTVTFTPKEHSEVVPPKEGSTYVVKDGTAVWSYTYTNKPCATTPPSPEPTTSTPPTTQQPPKAAAVPPTKNASATLPVTGAELPIGLMGGGVGLLLAGATFVTFVWRRRARRS